MRLRHAGYLWVISGPQGPKHAFGVRGGGRHGPCDPLGMSLVASQDEYKFNEKMCYLRSQELTIRGIMFPTGQPAFFICLTCQELLGPLSVTTMSPLWVITIRSFIIQYSLYFENTLHTIDDTIEFFITTSSVIHSSRCQQPTSMCIYKNIYLTWQNNPPTQNHQMKIA